MLILLQIFSGLYPQDLLNLDRTCLELHMVLLDHRCWEQTFHNVGLPPCPPDLSPHQYATLAFNPICQVGVRCPGNRYCIWISILYSFAIIPGERRYIGCVASDAVASAYISSMHEHNCVFRAHSRLPVSGHIAGPVFQTPTTSTSRMFSWGKVCSPS